MTTLQFLPATLAKAAPPAIVEATNQLATALEADEAAAAAEREARTALEVAPQEDEVKTRTAITQGKPTPPLTRPKREAEAEAAKRRASVTHDLAREAADHFTRVLAEHREELAREQEPRVANAADEVAKTLDVLAAQLQTLGEEAGVLHALHRPEGRREESQASVRARRMGRAPRVELPRFDPLSTPSVDVIRADVEDVRRNAVPIHHRILSATGDGMVTWDDVAAKLGVNSTDSEACAVRDWLLDDKRLGWCDPSGGPLIPSHVMAAAGVVVAQERRLRRIEPPLSPTQQARVEAAGRAA